MEKMLNILPIFNISGQSKELASQRDSIPIKESSLLNSFYFVPSNSSVNISLHANLGKDTSDEQLGKQLITEASRQVPCTTESVQKITEMELEITQLKEVINKTES